MEIIISHRSAFLYWRTFRKQATGLKRVHHRVVPGAALTEDVRGQLQRLGIPEPEQAPLDLLFLSSEKRWRPRGVTAHVTERELPRGSFVQVAENVLVVAPELCFVQLADGYSTEKLALAGCELCGTYAQEGPERTLHHRVPLTSAAALREYVSALGLGPASRPYQASRLVLDGAASPMEAKVSLLLSLSNTRGGYSLPAPVLNAPFHLSAEAHCIYPHSPCRLDLYWEEAAFALEYDGLEAHSGELHAKGVARAAALRIDGVDALSVSYAQVVDPDNFDRLAALVAKQLGIWLRVQQQPERFRARRASLRRELELG